MLQCKGQKLELIHADTNVSEIAFMYKISLATLTYKIHNNLTPVTMSAIIKNNDNIKRYQLGKNLKIDVPRFNTNYMRNCVARRRAIISLEHVGPST